MCVLVPELYDFVILSLCDKQKQQKNKKQIILLWHNMVKNKKQNKS